MGEAVLDNTESGSKLNTLTLDKLQCITYGISMMTQATHNQQYSQSHTDVAASGDNTNFLCSVGKRLMMVIISIC